MMSFMAAILFMGVVAPIWIVAHYVTRWRMAKSLTSEDERLFAELSQSADRMERRLNNLERILDADSPDWRQKL
ncbi:MAG: envelope stress response membrane protein PspB [Alphaproteobacteria bacterium]|nr:envelope stress response membrane protein PspB [Alphaproteobacteria bacterium]